MPPDHDRDHDDAGGFLARWSRRKAAVRQGAPLPAEPPAAAAAVVPTPLPAPAPAVAVPVAHPPVAEAPAAVPAPPPPPPPTLDDVSALAPGDEVSRFVAPGVDHRVKNAALKKLFADPHFNVMDGLDTYIDDYGLPDPLPEGMLAQMAQSSFLGLFTAAPDAPADDGAAAARPGADVPVPEPDPHPDENADLRLQPDDAAGCGAPAPGAGPHAGG